MYFTVVIVTIQSISSIISFTEHCTFDLNFDIATIQFQCYLCTLFLKLMPNPKFAISPVIDVYIYLIKICHE